jgi:hypothetical protein
VRLGLHSARTVPTRRPTERKQDCVNGKEQTMTRTWVLLAGLVLFAPAVDADGMIQGDPGWGQPVIGMPSEPLGPAALVAQPLPDHHVGVLPTGGLAAIQMPPGPLLDIATQIAQCLDAIRGTPGTGEQFDDLMAQVSARVHETLNALLTPAGTGIFLAQ